MGGGSGDSGSIRPRRVGWRLSAVLVIAVLGLAVLAVWAGPRLFRSELILKSCFQDVAGLRDGAEVRIAGVNVGHVRVVRAQPDNHACPALVEMVLSTPYELKIPRDSLAIVQTAGLLGGTYAAIDVSAASGSPIESGGTLESRFTPQATPRELLDLIDKISPGGLREGDDRSKGVQSVKP